MYIKIMWLTHLGCENLTRFKCECGSDEFISEPNSYDIVVVEEEIIIDHSEIIETSNTTAVNAEKNMKKRMVD